MSQRFVGISVSHHRAPVEVRERLALNEAELAGLLARLKGSVASEAMLLSTCNRTELYAIPTSEDISIEYLIDLLLSAKGIPHQEAATIRSYFDRLPYCDAITHLFRVIAGIDSQIIGDQQIFSQVKEAFRVSTELEMSGGFLTKLAHRAFRVAKRSITETKLTTGAATISYAAVEFTRKVYDDLRDRHVLIVGAGEMSELAAKHLVEKRAGGITVANRNRERATELLDRIAAGVRAEAIGMQDISRVLPTVDIVISATSATDYILSYDSAREALARRTRSSPLVMIDIAVPRDLDPRIATLPNVFLKDIDDLRSIVDRNLELRRKELPKVEIIVKEELDNFLAEISKLEVGPTIAELREKFESIRREELERQRPKLDERSFALLEDMTRRMMNRLLHAPMVSLKEPHASTEDLLTRIEIVRELFALDIKNLSSSTE